jgi:hypothetical protein
MEKQQQYETALRNQITKLPILCIVQFSHLSDYLHALGQKRNHAAFDKESLDISRNEVAL